MQHEAVKAMSLLPEIAGLRYAARSTGMGRPGSHQFHPSSTSPFACLRQRPEFPDISTFPCRPTLSCVVGAGVEIGVNLEPVCQTAHVHQTAISATRQRTRTPVEPEELGDGTTVVSRSRPLLFARFHVCRAQKRG
jgi:hypothetical protein